MAFQDAIKRQRRDPADVVRQLDALRQQFARDMEMARTAREAMRAVTDRIDTALDNARVVLIAIRQDIQVIRQNVQDIKTKVGA